MKKIITLLFATGMIVSAQAQFISDPGASAIKTAVPAGKIKPMHKPGSLGGKKWFNYGVTMNEIYTSSVLYLMPCFPDTGVVVSDGNGNYTSPFVYNIATILDPGSLNFAETAQPGDIVVYQKPYVLDSVGMFLQYVRNMDSLTNYMVTHYKDTMMWTDTTANGTDTVIVNHTHYTNYATLSSSKSEVVDTLILETFSNNVAANFFNYAFTDAGITSNYNTDTLFIITPKYTKNTNSVNASGKKTTKFPLDKAFYETKDGDGIQYVQIAANMNINAGRYPAASASFKPGYKVWKRTVLDTTMSQTIDVTRDTLINGGGDTTIVIDSVITDDMDIAIQTQTFSPDTLDNRNYTNFLSYEEQGTNTYPTYIKHDNNSSAIVETTVRLGTNPGGWNPYFIPTFAFVQAYSFENHWFDFLLSCPTCIGASVENQTAGFAVGTPYPNPAIAGETWVVPVRITSAAEIQVELSNALGQTIKTVSFNELQAGSHALNLETTGLQNGVYLYTIKANESRFTGKLFIAE